MSRRFTPEQIATGRVLLAELVRRYPAFGYPQRPLAIGIFSELQEKLPQADPKAIRAALMLWTTTTRYLNAVQARVERIDLYGAPAGAVSDEDQAGAKQWLNVRFAQRRRRDARERRAMLARNG
jgi:sRNA-binding protein